MHVVMSTYSAVVGLALFGSGAMAIETKPLDHSGAITRLLPVLLSPQISVVCRSPYSGTGKLTITGQGFNPNSTVWLAIACSGPPGPPREWRTTKGGTLTVQSACQTSPINSGFVYNVVVIARDNQGNTAKGTTTC